MSTDIGAAARPRSYDPYPEYKDSGVEWLGEVPEAWEVVPLKRHFSVKLGKMLQNEARTTDDTLEPYLRAANLTWAGVDTSDVYTMWISPKEKPSHELTEGDVLVSEGGDVGRSSLWQGQIKPCYFQNAINRVRSTGMSSQEFLVYWLFTLKAKGFIDVLCNKATIAHFTTEKLLNIPFLAPPLPEQQAIAAFLDRETAKIDALIAKKERLLELLQEKRAALITQAVTKGLDPNVPIKDSGVEWLGEVPAHWTVQRTKFAARLESGHTPSRQHPEYWENCTVPWFGLADVWRIRDGRTEYVSETEEKVSELGLANSAARRLPQGTVILSRTASVGFSAVMGTEMATTQDFVNWVPGPRMRSAYLLYVLRAMEREFHRLMMGSTHQTIYMPDVGQFCTPLPPVEEQDEIVRVVRRGLRAIDVLVDTVRSVANRLSELRTALISAAVTGKIDAREEVA